MPGGLILRQGCPQTSTAFAWRRTGVVSVRRDIEVRRGTIRRRQPSRRPRSMCRFEGRALPGRVAGYLRLGSPIWVSARVAGACLPSRSSRAPANSVRAAVRLLVGGRGAGQLGRTVWTCGKRRPPPGGRLRNIAVRFLTWRGREVCPLPPRHRRRYQAATGNTNQASLGSLDRPVDDASHRWPDDQDRAHLLVEPRLAVPSDRSGHCHKSPGGSGDTIWP
jgi:hypothetical protein